MNQDYATADKLLSVQFPTTDITYGDVLKKAREIAVQLPALMPVLRPVGGPLQPATSRPWAQPSVIDMDNDGVGRYVRDVNYVRLGVDSLENVLLDQIGILHCERRPDRITAARLHGVFEPCLVTTRIDLADDARRQLDHFFASNEPFVEFTSGPRHERLAERHEV